jgi:hypothetical protein
MKPILLALALLAALVAADQPVKKAGSKTPAAKVSVAPALSAAETMRVSRETVAGVEKSLDGGIRAINVNEPIDLLGFTRGVYLPGYGVVFSSEINLVLTIITPFRPEPKGAELQELKARKQRRLAVMRAWMHDALVGAGAALDQVPAQERVVFAMTLFYQSFEDRTGMPSQIIIEAPRQALSDFKAGHISREQLDAAIQTWEL